MPFSRTTLANGCPSLGWIARDLHFYCLAAPEDQPQCRSGSSRSDRGSLAIAARPHNRPVHAEDGSIDYQKKVLGAYRGDYGKTRTVDVLAAIRNTNGAPLKEEQPLRSELFNVEQLERHAKGLAASHQLTTGRATDKLIPRLNENEAILVGRTNS